MRSHLPCAGAISCIVLAMAMPAWSLDFPGPRPGPAGAKIQEGQLILENGAISAVWQLPTNATPFRLVKIVDRLSGKSYAADADAPFAISLDGKKPAVGGPFQPAGAATLMKLAPRPDALRVAERIPGWKACLPLVSQDGKIRVEWRAVLRDGSNYVQQEVLVRALGQDLAAKEFTLRVPVDADARVEGSVDGSPVVSGDLFAGCEHPMSTARVEGGVARCSVGTFGPIRAGQSCLRSWVVGVAPPGQMRRAFLYYLERERPRPYQPFLHYNSWYDIAWVDRKMNEQQCLEVIPLFGRELVEKRGVALDAAVFDDGWDDNKTLWGFHPGFPQGFEPLEAAAKKYHSAVGVWLSPWGGYAQAREERLKYGKTQGFETNKRGFSLAGPKYFARFRDVCAEMIRKYGVNYFKFDGIAQGATTTGAGREFARDVDALVRLLVELRRLRPDVFLSVTTGTWPSPFWLLSADSTWRNGSDMGFFGPGSKRQQWITYRDMIEYQCVVRRGPLYPINSLMTQGIAQAKLGSASQLGTDLAEWKDEVRSFFASGTQLQELYITPQMLTPAMWDVLAEGAAWTRKNAEVLVDVHWIGGDPGKGVPYGFAAWSPRQGMLALRNPTAKPARMTVDVQTALELPPGAATAYRLVSPWKDAPQTPQTVRAGKAETFSLAPFQVLVFDALPIDTPPR